jgi:hypothetical protein
MVIFSENRGNWTFFARILILAWIFSAMAILPVYGFRCGTRLVSIGDRAIDVRRNCGAPDDIQAWEEERVMRDFGTYRDDGSRYPTREPIFVKVHVKVEEWIYNLGPHMFIRILRFENGRLVEINTGDRGYPK